MKLIFQIVKTNLLLLVRDRRALIIMILMPLLLTSILSFALGGQFGGTKVSKFQVSIHNGDLGSGGRNLVQFFTSQKDVMTVHMQPSDLAARRDIQNGVSIVSVNIPADFSVAIASHRTADVNVFSALNNETKRQVVESMVNSYGKAMGIQMFLISRGIQLPFTAHLAPVSVTVKSTGLHPMTSGSYYAVGMMLLFLLNSATGRAQSMVEERGGDIYKRIQASPLSRYQFAIGYWVANWITMSLQGVVIMLGCRYILGITLGPWGQVASIVVAFGASLAGLTVFLGTLFKSPSVMDAVSGIGSQILAVLGGSIFPLFAFPIVFQEIGHWLPNGVALATLDNVIMGISSQAIVMPIVYLITFGLLLGLVGGTRYGKPA